MGNNDVIKSVSNNQHRIISDILTLHNDGKGFDVDITYSTGNFYGSRWIDGEIVTIPEPKYKFDVAPMNSGIVKIDPWGNIPLENKSVHSIMFDPPFLISARNSPSALTGTDNCLIFRRFSGYYPVNELLDSYNHWINEMYRVLDDNGFCVVKCQPTITSSKELNSHMFVWFCAECAGFDVDDEFILAVDNRIIGNMNKQQHARKFHSYFFVLKKGGKGKIPYLNFLTDNEIVDMVDKFKINNIGKNNGDKSYRNECVPQLDTMNQSGSENFTENALF